MGSAATSGAYDKSGKPSQAIASVMIDASAPASSDGFNYVRLEQPVVLRPHESYYLVSTENTYTTPLEAFPSSGSCEDVTGSNGLFGSDLEVDYDNNYQMDPNADWYSLDFAPLVNIKIN
jgi:hypothetical protein